MNFYPLHIGDYASGTLHLSWQEDLAYRRLLDLYYLREQPLPADLKTLCRLLRAREPELEAAVRTVLEEFFTPGPEGWRHKRCDAEIAQYNIKRDTASRNASRRWGPGGEAKGADAAPGQSRHMAEAMPGPGRYSADAAPAYGGRNTDAIPPHSGRDADAMPLHSGRDADAVPPHSVRNTDAMPPHGGRIADAMPPHSGRIADAVPPQCEGNATNPKTNPSTSTNPIPNPIPNPGDPRARAAGEACLRMKSAGISAVNPSHPLLADLLAAGATPQAFADLAAEIAERTPGKSMNYLLAVMQRRMSEKPHIAGPPRAYPPPRRNRNASTPPEEAHARPAVEPI